MIDPEGSIGPMACVDIVVRHTCPLSGTSNVTDKFRIVMQDHTTKQVNETFKNNVLILYVFCMKVLGRREVEAKLLSGEPDTASNEDNFHTFPQIERSEDHHQTIEYSLRGTR